MFVYPSYQVHNKMMKDVTINILQKTILIFTGVRTIINCIKCVETNINKSLHPKKTSNIKAARESLNIRSWPPIINKLLKPP